MYFDSDTVKNFEKILTDGLAYGVFLHEWAIVKEIENHLSGMLFQSPSHMLKTAIKLISFYIERAKTKSIIGYTEGPAGAIPIATPVANQMNLPLYSYNMEDGGAFSQFIEPELLPCSLIIPYSTNDIQVNDILGRFSKQGPQISQIISLVEEHPLKTNFSEKGIEYVKISDWNSIKDRIKQFRSLTNEKMSELLTNFG